MAIISIMTNECIFPKNARRVIIFNLNVLKKKT